MPPIPAPGHASYPSGHATQAHLMARLITRVLTGTVPPADLPHFVANLSALARRVARNREIAGVHYRSDSTAGDALAQALDPHLWNTLYLPAAPSVFKDTVDAAKGEWS